MNKVIITALLLCTGFVAGGCKERTYSIEEFKKDKELRLKWEKKCFLGGTSVQASQNCDNVAKAGYQLLFGG
ncbi:EexN family lipoprotein [Bartonella sp. ML70XJBT.G]|uniref:EexN family lipoprotein n=1 Tax=Bartonella sp. ML70XJBT.G TaxID=3019093 RepID=UPI00235EC9E5|nr:EexN family lipoprotein [Bartonella sp. ML70XJBT.G]